MGVALSFSDDLLACCSHWPLAVYFFSSMARSDLSNYLTAFRLAKRFLIFFMVQVVYAQAIFISTEGFEAFSDKFALSKGYM